MKKLLLALMLFPAVVVAQPIAKYQPATTPTPWLSTTPGAPGQSVSAFATDQYLRQQVIVMGQPPVAALAEVTPISQSVMLPTAVPTLFPVTPNALINTSPLRAIRINNQFNIDLNCTYGAASATPLPFTVPAQTQHYENFAANGSKMSSSVSCIKNAAPTPASGTLQVWGY